MNTITKWDWRTSEWVDLEVVNGNLVKPIPTPESVAREKVYGHSELVKYAACIFADNVNWLTHMVWVALATEEEILKRYTASFGKY